MVFVQIPLPVRVLIQRAQCESRFELAADLFVERVRELHAGVFVEQQLPRTLVVERIKRQRICQRGLLVVEDVVDAVVVAANERTARLEHAVAFAEHRLHLLDIAIRHRIDNQVEALICKRQRLRHIRLNHFDVVALAICDFVLTLALA